jgi:hypothetical protein
METLREVLRAANLKLPATRGQLLAGLLFRRSQLRLRGLSARERDESQITPDELQRVDLAWSLAVGFASSDVLVGAYFQTRSLLLALSAGEPARVARALLVEVAYSALDSEADSVRRRKLLAAARPYVQRSNDPVVHAWSVAAPGVVAFLTGDWRAGHRLCDEASRLFRERCAGAVWEANMMSIYSMFSLAYLGEAAELGRRVPVAVRDAESRGDIAQAWHLRVGVCNLAWLGPGKPDESLREIAAARQHFEHIEGYLLPSYWTWHSRGHVDLYLGDAVDGWRRITEGLPALEKSLLTRLQIIRHETLSLRARAALARAEATGDGSTLAAAEADCARIEREQVGWSLPIAQLVRAGIAHLAGDLDTARALLARVVERFDALGMGLHAAVARGTLAELTGGDEGRVYSQDAARFMVERGIVEPARMAAMIAPGFGAVGRRRRRRS